MTKLIKYVLASGVLTLTLLLENGDELVVPISGPAILDQMSLDLLDNFSNDDLGLRILKITRTIDPSDGAISCNDTDIEYEEGRVKQAVPQDPSTDFSLEDISF